jgi:hypothetical protein
VYPSEQLQLLNKLQDPFDEHTLELVEFIPKQDVIWQLFPEYSLIHVQLLNELQFPFPEQTLDSVEFIP